MKNLSKSCTLGKTFTLGNNEIKSSLRVCVCVCSSSSIPKWVLILDCTIIIGNTIYQDHNDCRSSKVPYIERCNSLLLKFQLLKASFWGPFLSSPSPCWSSRSTCRKRSPGLGSSPFACRPACLLWNKGVSRQSQIFRQISKAHYAHGQWLRWQYM